MSLVSNPKDGDNVSVRQAIARLGSSKLGPASTPTFAGITTSTLTISGLTTNSLVYPVSGLLTSLGAATNGQIPIGSTGAAPVLATLTGTANQVTVTNGAGSITLSTPQDIDTAADVEFQSLLIDQNTDAIGLTIDSAATTDTNYGLSVTTTAGAMVAQFLNGDGNAGMCYLGLNSNNSFSGTYFFGRNLTATSTDCAVVYMLQDHADDDQPVLELRQDGTGYALLAEGDIKCNGDMLITGTTTYEGNIVIPDDGWIGSATTPQSIQIEADGDVVFIGAIDVPSDIVCGGHVIFDVDNGHIGYLDNSPIMTFNDSDNQIESLGNLVPATDAAYDLGAVGANDYRWRNLYLSGNLSDETNELTVANCKTAYDHVTEDGSSHTYIDQDVTITSSPTFAGLTVTNCAVLGSNSAVFQPNADSTTFFQVNDKDGNNILTVDTTNNGLEVDHVIISGTSTYGIDLSSGTWSSGVMNWDANPNVYANGTKVIGFDDTNYNMLLGSDAFANDNGQFNVGIGYQAGYNNDTTGVGEEGDRNTYIGYLAGYGATPGVKNTGMYNTGIGDYSLYCNTSGSRNVAIGSKSLYQNTTGNFCFGLGNLAGRYNVDGDQHVYIGYAAGYSNVSSDYNIAIGSLALYTNTAANCLGIGYKAGNKTDGSNNVFIGKSSCEYASGNTRFNTNVGSYSGYGSDGSAYEYNTYIGFYTAGRGTTASKQVVVGAQSCYYNLTGNNGIYIGYRSGGYGAGSNQASLANHVVIGYESGYNLLDTSTSNTLIGYRAGYTMGAIDGCVHIGNQAGYRNVTDNILIIDNQDRGSAALELTNSLIYGVFDATPASQTLRFNVGNLYLGNPTHSDADGGGAVIQSFIREDGAGTASTAATITSSHDGAGANDTKGKLIFATDSGAGLVDALTIDSAGAVDVVGAFTAGTVRSDDGVSGTLILDDGTTERITLVFTGGILTSRTVEATVGALIDWTD